MAAVRLTFHFTPIHSVTPKESLKNSLLWKGAFSGCSGTLDLHQQMDTHIRCTWGGRCRLVCVKSLILPIVSIRYTLPIRCPPLHPCSVPSSFTASLPAHSHPSSLLISIYIPLILSVNWFNLQCVSCIVYFLPSPSSFLLSMSLVPSLCSCWAGARCGRPTRMCASPQLNIKACERMGSWIVCVCSGFESK